MSAPDTTSPAECAACGNALECPVCHPATFAPDTPTPETETLRARVAELERYLEGEKETSHFTLAAHVKLTETLRTILRLTDPRDEAIIEAVLNRELAAVESRLAREGDRLAELRRLRGGM